MCTGPLRARASVSQSLPCFHDHPGLPGCFGATLGCRRFHEAIKGPGTSMPILTLICPAAPMLSWELGVCDEVLISLDTACGSFLLGHREVCITLLFPGALFRKSLGSLCSPFFPTCHHTSCSSPAHTHSHTHTHTHTHTHDMNTLFTSLRLLHLFLDPGKKVFI